MRYEKRVNLTKSLNEYFKFLNGKYKVSISGNIQNDWSNNNVDYSKEEAKTLVKTYVDSVNK